MSIIVTPEELEHYRATLADYPDALLALTEIQDCEGDLEDAAIAIAIQVGQEPDTNEGWIDGLAKRWRHILCEATLKERFEAGLSGNLLTVMAEQTTLPLKLATPVAIYVLKTGIATFCEPLTEKIR